MKKLAGVLVVALLLLAPAGYAEEGLHSGYMHGEMENQAMMKMFQCPMDKYTSEKPGECPRCGMKLEEKEMTADEAKAALEESKSE